MVRLKLVSAKIPDKWIQKLERYTKSTGSTQSAIIREAIGAYLEKVDPVDHSVDHAEKTVGHSVSPLRSEIEEIKARLAALERLTQLTMVDPPPIAIVVKPKPIESGAMRTGELFAALKTKGYTRSMASLLRALNRAIETQSVPDELAVFGVRCDFELKRSANPRSSSLRWLFLDPIG